MLVANQESGATMTQLGRRLLLFLAPFIVLSIFLGVTVIRVGELLPVSFVAWLQTFGRPFIFLPQLSDHTYKLKLEAIRRRRPEVLVLGSSRANQWRSAMFRPATFYNGSNTIYVLRDFRRVLEELGDYVPRVIIFSLDYFVFVPDFEAVYKNQSKDELGGWGSPEQISVINGLLDEAVLNPGAFLPPQDDGIHGVSAFGLSAIKTGTGVRLDGSYQYGHVIRGFPQISLESAAADIREGKQWPIIPASQLDDALLREFERFTDLARRKGIALVGVTTPFAPQVLAAIDESPLYQAWRQFDSSRTKEWIRSQGVIYFDFTRLEDFVGKADEFADPFHPSEPAYIRMLLTMLDDPKFRALFPRVDPGSLSERLKQATRLEAYRNEF
jgi:hypothetical protein